MPALGDLPDPCPVAPLAAPPDAEATVPGGRSITNRALVAAALADGTSVLEGVGTSDDTEAMVDCLRGLGAAIEVDEAAARATVTGVAGRPQGPAEVFARLSGTTSRFVTPVAALAGAPVRVDAAPPMRARPMGDLLDALRALGVAVAEEGEAGHLPVTVTGPPSGREVAVPGTTSSQFVSGLLLAGAALPEGLVVRRSTERLVSAPYVDMTRSVMAAFGVAVADAPDGALVVPGGGYRAATYAVEPDAATAGYLLAAAAMTGGRVRVPGLPPAALQADAALVEVLAAMGATVRRDAAGTEVTGPAPGADGRVHLRGGTFDLTAFSDMAPTVAVLAALADEPVEVTGVGFIRGKETDRIAAPVTELRRCGVDAAETDDGFVVRPGGDGPHGATFSTYDDHRMAMSFALLGLVVEGVAVRDPGCVAKTFPGFFTALDDLRR
ncbi:3-phosphoshikimate 1-carboxyvinyltransferase [Iamia majanohamensis]|uniref:3-phosphoshikimate 1-carboxyvinyltransferase n=1 Tax=Iamia majanohamensis TaxID=467976 RepID=A0AAF0BXT4_9ACTN|nr:3-phosphoshikimate 1-carboxyvinyltransferase [Iamia majanohamensis]WCO69144.1 3-phosphoshikimate 1-carboxyvinyltransferase [Iamia majanohamensis]